MWSSYGNCITDEVTEMPRSFSSAIQSEVALRVVLRDFTEPAIWIAPPNSSSFSVSVVLPASGWEMMAKVRRRRASWETSDMGAARAGAPGGKGRARIIAVARNCTRSHTCGHSVDAAMADTASGGGTPQGERNQGADRHRGERARPGQRVGAGAVGFRAELVRRLARGRCEAGRQRR